MDSILLTFGQKLNMFEYEICFNSSQKHEHGSQKYECGLVYKVVRIK